MKTTIIISLLSLASLSVSAQAVNTQVTTSSHAVCMKAPDMPRNAKPVFPTTSYTPTQDPSCPPCYEYKKKSGLVVMECPFLWFPAENATKAAPATMQGSSASAVKADTYSGYTGN